MAFYQFYREQKINISLDEIWDFISSPKNLKEITPDHMGFEIQSKHIPEKIYNGMIIVYKVRLLFGIRNSWVTEITQLREKEYFVDEQRIGPYSLWHHQHFVVPIEKGVLMKDIITYKPPLGIFGAIANELFIEKELHRIFDYRKVAIEKRFGVYE
jgi:ligand-binding SRPBCC domain-containing protein